MASSRAVGNPSLRMDDDEPLQEIRHRFRARALATGRVARTAARIATRRLLGRENDAKDLEIGEALAKELDSMKGLAMKVGQILSYFDGVLPDATHQALRKLQAGARPVRFDEVRAVAEEDLGRPLGDVFERFDEQAVAAASIGQVHRARFEGREVAVKIQYPQVAATLATDFGRIEKLAVLASLGTAVDGTALAHELKERMISECDYRLEAAWQQAFARAFEVDDDVHIPEVMERASTARVLTTEWVDGLDFYAFADEGDGSRRQAAARTLVRFAFRSLFVHCALQADPHPGNYIFPSGAERPGTVTFLDFGCVRGFEPGWLVQERALVRVVLDGDRARFNDALVATGQVPRPDRFDFDLHWRMLRHQWAPYLEPTFSFRREWMREALEFSGPKNPNLRQLAIPPPWVWQMRLIWGLHAVLIRLGADGPFRDLLHDALDEDAAPLRL